MVKCAYIQAERELLMKERRARIEAEREKEELMKRLQQYEEEAKAANHALVCLYHIVQFLMEKILIDNILGRLLLAILETIERENFDKSLHS